MENAMRIAIPCWRLSAAPDHNGWVDSLVAKSEKLRQRSDKIIQPPANPDVHAFQQQPLLFSAFMTYFMT